MSPLTKAKLRYYWASVVVLLAQLLAVTVMSSVYAGILWFLLCGKGLFDECSRCGVKDLEHHRRCHAKNAELERAIRYGK